MGWTPEMARNFIKTNLGPNLRTLYPDVKLLIVDDQRYQVVNWLRVVSTPTFAKANTNRYIDILYVMY